MKTKNKNILLNFDEVINTYKSKKHGIKALSKYHHWFPIYTSSELAGIVADLMGDGHLQGEPKLRLDYTSKSIRELNRFDKEIWKLFKIKGKIRECKTNRYGTYNLGINNKPLARVLELSGVPSGAKVLSKFSIPNWILEDKKLFSRFINRLFSCESCVDVWSKCIEIKMFKSLDLIKNGIEFFEEIRHYLMGYFNIKTTAPFLQGGTNIRKDGIQTKGIRLKIKRKESLKNFRKYIGLEDKNKAQKLNKILK